MDYAGVVSGGIGIVKSWVEFWVKGVVKAEIKQLESWAAKTSLPKAVQNNVDRFVKKAPANSKESLIVEKMSNGNYSATVKSPWKVPGSSAEYKKIIDWKWKTVEMKKTTYSPSWDTIHVKDKLKK